MKKTLKLFVLTLVLAAMATTVEAKRVKTSHMYMFGFAASFVDSTLYLTDVQDVQGAWYDTKDKCLMLRDSYSDQLKEYMKEKMGQPNRVCLVIFAKTKKKAEKKYQKLKKKYMSKDGIIHGMKYLTAADFKFTAIDASEE
ncbi:MAG: hypothetical protein IJ929_11340 [Prevotella sp.]|nr:hypothetical protein [Prevotella sp.]